MFKGKQYTIYYPANAADSVYRYLVSEFNNAKDAVKKATLREIPSNLSIVVYPSITTMYESNIGSSDLEVKPFPFFQKKGKRIVLAFNGNYTDFKEQLYESMSRIVCQEQIKRYKSEPELLYTTIDDVPYWFCEGVVKYCASGWQIKDEDGLKEVMRKVDSWNALSRQYPKIAGQAFSYYISQKYYKTAIAQIMFQLKKKDGLNAAVRLVLKNQIDSLTEQCYRFYKARYISNVQDDNINNLTLKIALPDGVIENVLLNENKTHVAFTIRKENTRSVYIYKFGEHRMLRVAKYILPPWLNIRAKDQYPIVEWQGGSLFVIQPIKGKIVLQEYSKDGSKLESNILLGIDGVTSFVPIKQNEFLMSAYREGQSDIIVYNTYHDKVEVITDDIYDDYSPVVLNNSIYWLSSRPKKYSEQRIYYIGVGYKKDTLWQGLYVKSDTGISNVLVDTVDFRKLTQLNTLNGNKLLFSSTKSGEAYYSEYDVQTGQQKELFAVKPMQYLSSKDEVVEYKQQKDSLEIAVIDYKQWSRNNKSSDSTSWLKEYLQLKIKEEQEAKLLNRNDTFHYFIDDILKATKDTTKGKKKKERKRFLNYDETTPYTVQLFSSYYSAQINNDFFINKYQPYKAYQGEFKFPELGGIMKGGYTDVFENHHLNIAYRIPTSTEGSDFSVKYENYKKKWDWGIIYFRKVETLKPDDKRDWKDEQGRNYPSNAKVKTHYYELYIRRPITYWSAISYQTALRRDQTIFLATNKYTLDFPDLKAAWSINTVTYTIRNIKKTLPGLLKGYKYSLAIDGFKGFDKDEAFVYALSVNAEWHKPSYKYITAVGQIHAGTSGGDRKILYNLGGIENNITPQKDTSVHFNQIAPYAFQTLVTPFRGYLQNSLYGNVYLLANLDVYFPVFSTLIPIETPLPFINNMVVGLLCDNAIAKESWKYRSKVQYSSSFGLSIKSTLAGYPVRLDVAWPGTFHSRPVWYLSLSM